MAVTEFIAVVTGLREPKKLVYYYAHRGITTVSTDTPREDCYYCKRVRGHGDEAGLERFLKSKIILRRT